MNMSRYEIIVIYNKEYGEVIEFESNSILNDVNDIVKDKIFVPLPRIQNDIDKKQYVCRMIGMSLIELCNIKCSFKQMVLLLYGFFPEFNNISELMLNLFEERLYESVLSSKEQNSDIENNFKLQRYDFIHNLKSKINNKRKSIIFK